MRILTGILTALLCFVLLPFAHSQTGPVSLRQYLEWVNEGHPILKSANLLPEQARAELTQARGAFDPVIMGDWDRKVFDDKNYWDRKSVTFKQPVWSSIEFKTGWENNDGTYLNPEFNTPEGGLYYAGLSIPVGRGLVMDERRNAIQLARIALDISEAERRKLANKVMAEAAKTWWIWWEAYQQYSLYEEATELAVIRMEATVQSILNGDKPGIDSVEARVEILKRQTSQAEARLALQNARVFASAFLWDAENQPVELPEDAVPGTAAELANPPTPAESAEVQEWSQFNHPEILKLNLKNIQLERQSFLAKQNLLPDVRLDVIPLYTSVIPESVNRQNYKLGLSVYVPLFLRKERGKLQTIQIKREINLLEQQDMSREVNANVRAANQAIEQFRQLRDLQIETVDRSGQLREAEIIRLENGESSLFLVNRRERSWVSSRIKLVSYEAKFGKSIVNYFLAAGTRFPDGLTEVMEE